MHNTGTLLMKLVMKLFSLLFIFPAILFSILVLCLTDELKSGMVMLVCALILHIIVKLSSFNISFPQRVRYYVTDQWERESFGEWPNAKETPPPLDEIYRDIDVWNSETETVFRIIREREQGVYSDACSEHCSKCTQIKRNG